MSDEDKRLEEEQATQMLHDSLYDEEKERRTGIIEIVYDSWAFEEKEKDEN
tara:strand:+ start:202 stop:354 length:153 start_codon:yes stop_codon:yes gene_type:complete